MTIQEAIDLYTKGGAYAAMREDCLGQLLPGYFADFIILDSGKDDIIEKPEVLLKTKVAEVWVAGSRKI